MLDSSCNSKAEPKITDKWPVEHKREEVRMAPMFLS